MGTFREDLLADIDDIRAIPGADFDMRQFSVFVRITSSAGSRLGLGAKTVDETQLLVGGQNPKVTQVKSKDTVAGTSEYQAAEWQVGPLTPGITTPDVINPPSDGTPREVVYRLVGPGLPDVGVLCQRVYDNTDKNYHYTINIKSSGRRKPT